MKNIVRVLFALLLLNSALSGCSVKEDRDDCPCRLVLDLSDIKSGLPGEVFLSLCSDFGYIYSRLFPQDNIPDTCVINVPKGEVFIGCFSPASSISDRVRKNGCTSEIVAIEKGGECPEILMYCTSLKAAGESEHHKVELHKNYCRLNIEMKIQGEEYPFLLRIDGNISGYGALGKPVPGDFSVRKRAAADGRFSICVPRQTDGSLCLSILEGDDMLRKFALGEYIIESGYDWNSPDLKDIDMELDFSKTDLHIKIDLWTTTVPLNILI